MFMDVAHRNGITEKIALPEGETTISDSAFWNCSSLMSITIPDDVMTIGDSAFAGCLSLKSIAIPKNIRTIGFQAFRGIPEIVEK